MVVPGRVRRRTRNRGGAGGGGLDFNDPDGIPATDHGRLDELQVIKLESAIRSDPNDGAPGPGPSLAGLGTVRLPLRRQRRGISCPRRYTLLIRRVLAMSSRGLASSTRKLGRFFPGLHHAEIVEAENPGRGVGSGHDRRHRRQPGPRHQKLELDMGAEAEEFAAGDDWPVSVPRLTRAPAAYSFAMLRRLVTAAKPARCTAFGSAFGSERAARRVA